MTITDEMIEAGARALCRLRIEHNHRFDKEPRDEAFKKRCEDAAWQDFVVEAKAALEAAERAAWRPIEEDFRGGERRLLLWEAFGNIRPHVELGWYRAGTGYVNTYGKPFHGDPTHFRPLPRPGEPDV